MSDLVSVKRALISVSDKSGLADFAKALHVEFGVELISTGGTARFLRDQGLPVIDVSQVTGFPEMMDGRVKTLHPNIHGALLGLRDNAEHLEAMLQHGIQPIDLVCVNLYPFEATVSKPDATFEQAIENIDIGGPSMIRSAAKNHRSVLVVTSVREYADVLADLREHKGASCGRQRLEQAQRAFAHTAHYDAAIAQYLSDAVHGHKPGFDRELPDQISISLRKQQQLRYGENPHQKGALYVAAGKPREASVAFATQLHGMELSYINLLDADGALALVKEFKTPAACIVKHATPCGCATAADLPTAFTRAYDGDSLAAFGGIVALNQNVDLPTAQAITAINKLLHVIVAPSYSEDALQLLRNRWKNVRLLQVGPLGDYDRRELHMHKIMGGYLVQRRDLLGDREDATEAWKVVSKRQPTAEEMAELRFAWVVCKHVKSNAIAITRQGMLVGAGAGQMDRPAAARLAIEKAGDRLQGAVAASDAFFPFPDGPELLLNAGVQAIIQPGGAMKDQETIDLVDRRGAAMVFTGQRHFRH